MINLLPNETKTQLKAARINTLLVKFLLILIVGGAFVGGAILYSNMNSNSNDATSQNSINEQYRQYNEQATGIDSKIAEAKSVLSSRINFSEIMLAITESLPDSVALDSISLNTSNVNGSTSVEFNAHGSKKFVSTSMDSDPGFESKYPTMFSDYRLISSQKNAKYGTTNIKFSLIINYSKGL